MVKKEQKERKRIVLPTCRISYPALFTPRPSELYETPRFQVQCMWEEGTDFSELKSIIKELKAEEFGDTPVELKSCFKTKEWFEENVVEHPEIEEYRFIANPWSTKPVVVMAADGKTVLREEDGEVYGGMYGRVAVVPYIYKKGANKGVGLHLVGVQKVKDGPRFGSQVDPSTLFEPIAGAPVAGGDDEDDMEF